MSELTDRSLHLCHPYIWEDPRFIFKSWNYDGNCVSELVNRIFAIYIPFLLIGALLSTSFEVRWAPIVFGIFATILLIPTFMKLRTYEKFMNPIKGCPSSASDSSKEEKREKAKARTKSEGFVPELVKGSENNPFMNILIDEYKYSPTRSAAPDISTTESKIALDSMFRTQWYSDPTDVFGKTQNQRIFLTQPVTTIPNDQHSYQNWLYKIPGLTCKEGNADACWGGTDGGVLPWLNL